MCGYFRPFFALIGDTLTEDRSQDLKAWPAVMEPTGHFETGTMDSAVHRPRFVIGGALAIVSSIPNGFGGQNPSGSFDDASVEIRGFRLDIFSNTESQCRRRRINHADQVATLSQF